MKAICTPQRGGRSFFKLWCAEQKRTFEHYIIEKVSLFHKRETFSIICGVVDI